MPRQKFVMGNWKMQGNKATVQALLAQIQSIKPVLGSEIIVFPPYIYLPIVSHALAKSALQWGAQNLSAYAEGAYTGEVSANMLKDYDCRYVLIGHSERRQYFGETEEIIRQKFIQAAKSGLRPVLCVGESLEERKANLTQQKILVQIESVLKYRDASQYLTKAVIAYEPVWAIGTGLTATPQEAQEVHHYIREILQREAGKTIAENMSIIYGGSVKAANAKSLFAMPDIDGGLVGGASLIGEEFKAICHAVE